MGVEIETIKEGDGQTFPQKGQIVEIHYTGTLTNGGKFDSSRDRGWAFQFELGAGKVIKGWDEGVAQLSIGQRAKLTVTPDFGFGASGIGKIIPPNSTLIYDVELIRIISTSATSGARLKNAPSAQSSSGQSTYFTKTRPKVPNKKPQAKYEAYGRYPGHMNSVPGEQGLGPTKSTKDDFIRKLFERASEYGAEEVDPNGGQQSGTIQLKIKLWENGFETYDGQLRNYEDPGNRQFLETIMEGGLPVELLVKYKGAPIKIDLVKSGLYEQYIPSANVNTSQSFQGQGHFLESPTASVKSNEEAGKISVGQVPVNVDESKPTTRIKIRQADGIMNNKVALLERQILRLKTRVRKVEDDLERIQYWQKTRFYCYFGIGVVFALQFLKI